MRPDGSNLVNLTADSALRRVPRELAGRRRKIVFMSDRETPSNPMPPGFPGPDFEIFVMNADGSKPRRSPSTIATTGNPRGRPTAGRSCSGRISPIRGQDDYDIFTIRANGTRERSLTNSPGVRDVDPDWSPDGRRIAFVSDRDGDDEIYTMKPDGSRVRQLTANDGRTTEDRAGRPTAAGSPSTATAMPTRRRPSRSRSTRCAPTAATQTRLTFDVLSDFLPSWSPDGRRIAFSSFRECHPGEDFNSEIYTMRADGSRLANLTHDPAFDADQDWQPLGRHHHGGDWLDGTRLRVAARR